MSSLHQISILKIFETGTDIVRLFLKFGLIINICLLFSLFEFWGYSQGKTRVCCGKVFLVFCLHRDTNHQSSAVPSIGYYFDLFLVHYLDLFPVQINIYDLECEAIRNKGPFVKCFLRISGLDFVWALDLLIFCSYERIIPLYGQTIFFIFYCDLPPRRC